MNRPLLPIDAATPRELDAKPFRAAASTTPTNKVLLLGNDDRVLLAVARSLGRRGVRSHLAWHRSDSLARHSRYVDRTHTLPPYDAHSDGWLRALRETIIRHQFDLVIPCNESTVVPLQRHRHAFEDLPGIYLLDQEVFELTFDKPRTTALACELGLAIPETVENQGNLDAEAVVAKLGLPVIIKPRATFKNQESSNVVRRVGSMDELRMLLSAGESDDAMLIQQCFVGTGMGVELLAHAGKILLAFQHQRLHESIEYGSSYRKSVPLNPELLDAAARLVAALGYTGVAMVEFIVNLETGRWVFLEINGRFWGSLPLAVAAGADFPFYLYEMLVLGRGEFPQHYRQDVYCRNLLLDFQGIKLRGRANGQPRHMNAWTMAEDLTTIVRGHDHLDNFTLDDPLPGLRELSRVAGIAVRKLRGRLTCRSTEVSPTQAKTTSLSM